MPSAHQLICMRFPGEYHKSRREDVRRHRTQLAAHRAFSILDDVGGACGADAVVAARDEHVRPRGVQTHHTAQVVQRRVRTRAVLDRAPRLHPDQLHVLLWRGLVPVTPMATRTKASTTPRLCFITAMLTFCSPCVTDREKPDATSLHVFVGHFNSGCAPKSMRHVGPSKDAAEVELALI